MSGSAIDPNITSRDVEERDSAPGACSGGDVHQDPVAICNYAST